MWRRRWRFVIIATFLLCLYTKDTKCQDENYYYTNLERNFAQIQPSIYPNNHPNSYIEHGDSYKISPTTQQSIQYNERHLRFPTPNYNQKPSPFQLTVGRSPSGAQYYINQPDYTSASRQRFRPALPHNYQYIHLASTNRPDLSQIHSIAYKKDPSKPETFLGQITINNPDIDFLHDNRFKNVQIDGNSLKNSHSHSTYEDIDSQDMYDHHTVTTYNPNKFINKPRLNIKPSSSRLSHYDISSLEEKNVFQHDIRNDYLQLSKTNSSKDIKMLLELEPLLEGDISDISSLRQRLKNNNQGSYDVEVIKSTETDVLDRNIDSKADASFLNSDNTSKDLKKNISLPNRQVNTVRTSTMTTTTEHVTPSSDEVHSAEIVDDGEYVEYYDEEENNEIKKTTIEPTDSVDTTESVTDIYDDYDVAEEVEKNTELQNTHENIEHNFTSNAAQASDDLITKRNQTIVEEDSFQHVIDTTIGHEIYDKDEDFTTPATNKEDTSIETPSILHQEVVSVVTTKSVVNGTISIPDVTFAPSISTITTLGSTRHDNNSNIATTENWIVVASVQTSRSVSGARFLPFPTVEQEEKKQVLLDEFENEDNFTRDPIQGLSDMFRNSSSTENINDKLDSIQSELSSDVLSGTLDSENENIELIKETIIENATSTTTVKTTTPVPTSVNVFTLKSTQSAVVTEKSAPDPLPVMIKKFSPRITTSTTPKPKKKPSLVTVMDDLSGFLPPGYKQRLSYKDKRTSTTSTSTTTTTTTTTIKPVSDSDDIILNSTQGRSSGISSKNKVIILDDKSLLPKEYKPNKETKTQEDKNFSKSNNDALLYSDFKVSLNKTGEDKEKTKLDILNGAQKVDISAFLPKGYNFSTSTIKPAMNIPKGAVPIDITALLPPGFKLNKTDDSSDDLISKFKISDISSLLPPGYTSNKTTESATVLSTSTTKGSGLIKLVFPSRPGSKPIRKNIVNKPVESGPVPVTPKIQKGWPTRASTEFTGWPSPSTTPFSIEKLLEAQRNATATSPRSESSAEETTRSITTTTTTTAQPPMSTTPGICRKECDIAATIKIVAGAQWVPELLDHNTDEWQKLAKEVKYELNSVYSKSDLLKKWYKGIRIDGFTQGSVLVDYFIELNNIQEKVNTVELKQLFHNSLHKAKPGSVMESSSEISASQERFDMDIMLGDQPDEERMKKSNEQMTKTIDKSTGKLEFGKFVMDPAYTEFIVLPKREEPKIVMPPEESVLPQWGIAVIVIALASLLFVVIFGVTVLVNRQKSTKAKQPIPLSEDMLRELDKSHMGGFDDIHPMKERELPYIPTKRMSSAFIEQLAYPNPGDSWRSEWTPQMQKYMQHYATDSGRGSQLYGAPGNIYGYGGGSQLYGQTGGGGSQIYGYSGEHPRPHFARRRSDYDSNF